MINNNNNNNHLPNSPVVVLLSGGMDSAVLLSMVKSKHQNIFLLHLSYGQKTSVKEKKCFYDLAEFYEIPKAQLKIIDLNFLKEIGQSSLTDQLIAVKKNSTLEELAGTQEIPSSYVPFRNSIILSLAVSLGESIKAQKIFIGANEEDSPGYPDCRKEYYDEFNQLIKVGTKFPLSIITPLLDWTKAKIVAKGIELKTPFQLTWSCYDNPDAACGQCDSCLLRIKGFSANNIKDPIDYQSF